MVSLYCFFDNGRYDLCNNSSVAIYTCDVGYSLQGSAVRACKEDGTGWDIEAPTCGELILFL